MSWLARSFDQYTIAWLLITSIIGGIVGASIKFIFEGLLAPHVSSKRDVRRLVNLYTAPLLRSAETLERRINNLLRNNAKAWYSSSEYYRMSTLYSFAEYLGWVKAIERDFGFVPYEGIRRGKQFNRHLYGLFRALSSFAYFRWCEDETAVEESLVPRDMLKAIGEAMTRDVPDRHVKEFTQFLYSYANDATFARWFLELDQFLLKSGLDSVLRLERLIAAGANLRALIAFLDPKGKSVEKRQIANLESIKHIEVRDELEKEFPMLLPTITRNANS